MHHLENLIRYSFIHDFFYEIYTAIGIKEKVAHDIAGLAVIETFVAWAMLIVILAFIYIKWLVKKENDGNVAKKVWTYIITLGILFPIITPLFFYGAMGGSY